MTSDLDSTAPGPSERDRLRKFYPVYLTAAVLFVGAGVLANASASGVVTIPAPWSTVVAFLPLLPAAGLFAVGIRYVLRSDEYEQRLAFRAAGIAFVGMLAAALLLGALDYAGITVPSGYWALFTVGLLIWGAVAFARYQR